MFLEVVSFFNLGGLLVGALSSFLLTFWRRRLSWIDWTIALLLNVPAASVWIKFVSVQSYDCEEYCYLMMFGGTGIGIGLLFGLLCTRLAIASIPKTPEA